MRLGIGIGPFYASTSTRRRKGETGCFPILLLAALVAVGISYWRIVVAVAAALLVAASLVVIARRRAANRAATHTRQQVAALAAEEGARPVGWHRNNHVWRYWDGRHWNVGNDVAVNSEPGWYQETMRARRWWEGERWTGHTIQASSRRSRPPEGPEPDVVRFPGWYLEGDEYRYWNGDEWTTLREPLE